MINDRNKNRFFSPVEAELIRDYQKSIGRGIDNFTDEDVANVASLVEWRESLFSLRKRLGQERRKQRDKVGDEPYLNFCDKAKTQKKDSETGLTPLIDITSVHDIPIHLIRVDEKYQREVDEPRVKKIAANFDPRLCGTLTVARRADGTLWVVDGQHRLKAAIVIGLTHITCQVFNSSGSAVEAALFYRIQKERKAVGSVGNHKSLVEAGDPDAVAIQEVLNRYGFCISTTGSRSIKAAVAVKGVYKQGVLDQTMSIISELSRNCTAHEWSSFYSVSSFIGALGCILANPGCKDISRKRLIEVLSKLSAADYLKLSNTNAGAGGNRAPFIARAMIEQLYNKRLSEENKLTFVTR